MTYQDYITRVEPQAETFMGYSILSQEGFINLKVEILDTKDHGDFLVSRGRDCSGKFYLFIQGILTGAVLVSPLTHIAVTYPSFTEQFQLQPDS